MRRKRGRAAHGGVNETGGGGQPAGFDSEVKLEEVLGRPKPSQEGGAVAPSEEEEEEEAVASSEEGASG
jgi:hypothetical protein